MKSILLALLFFVMPAMAEFQVPALPNPVNDYANVLTRAGKEKIATDIINLKKATGAQAGVLIVNSLDGSSVEEATIAAFRQWKLGSKDRDDGILLFIAVKDRKIRLEVGYGLESIVTDYHAKQVTASMKSALRSGNYDLAVSTAINGVNARIRAHADEITSKSNSPTPTKTESSGFGVFFLALMGILGLGAFFVIRRNSKAREQDEREERHRQSIEYVKRATMPPVRRPAAEEKASRRPSSSDDDSFTRGMVTGAIIGSSFSSSDSSSSYSSSDSSSSSSSDWGGGGGDSGGGGSSDSW